MVPRLARYGEAVDDHQLQVATVLDDRTLGDASTIRATSARVAFPAPVAADDRGVLLGPLVEVVADEVRRGLR